jgi:hypothetical protein
MLKLQNKYKLWYSDNNQVEQANIPCDNDPKDLIEKLIDFTITDGDLTEKEKSG